MSLFQGAKAEISLFLNFSRMTTKRVNPLKFGRFTENHAGYQEESMKIFRKPYLIHNGGSEMAFCTLNSNKIDNLEQFLNGSRMTTKRVNLLKSGRLAENYAGYQEKSIKIFSKLYLIHNGGSEMAFCTLSSNKIDNLEQFLDGSRMTTKRVNPLRFGRLTENHAGIRKNQ